MKAVPPAVFLPMDTASLEAIQKNYSRDNRAKQNVNRNPDSVRAKRRERRDNTLSAPFLVWDGEGTTNPDGPQPYILFGCSGYEPLISESDVSLPSKLCLEFILKIARENPEAIHAAYAFDYDVNQILWQMPRELWRTLYKENEVRWAGCSIRYIPGKFITLSAKRDGEIISVTIYDVFTFFGTKFTKAVKDWLGDSPELARIEKGKAGRKTFAYSELQDIKEYWTVEGNMAVKLCHALRSALHTAGLFPKHWHGPGALADFLFKTHGIREHMNWYLPKEVMEAAQHGYAAGRFELFRCGNYEGNVYANDLNSAYPYAIAQLPSLRNAKWNHWADGRKPKEYAHFGIYLIRSKRRDPQWDSNKPMPLFYRHPGTGDALNPGVKGTISFPEHVYGWYWSPEASLVWRNPNYEILEGYELEDNGIRPFAKLVHGLYEKRLAFKAEKSKEFPKGHPAQLACKLGMNSLYGKMAQRIGWKTWEELEEQSSKNKNPKPVKRRDGYLGMPPTWHQLEWAGWVTSFCRMKMYKALRLAHIAGGLIACETDSVITTVKISAIGGGHRKLTLDATKLGMWDEEEYDGVTYLQSGLGWLREKGGHWKQKVRGLDKPEPDMEDALDTFDLTRPRAIRHLDSPGVWSTLLETKVTRFYGVGKALQFPRTWKKWRRWILEDKEICIGGKKGGKRIHNTFRCPLCREGKEVSPADDLHWMFVGPGGSMKMLSMKHRLPWLGEITDKELEEESGRHVRIGRTDIQDEH